MQPFELRKLVYDTCRQSYFPSDVRQLFPLIRNNPFVAGALKSISNIFQSHGNDLLLHMIFEAYLTANKVFVPRFAYEMEQLICDTETPRIFLNLHSNFSPLLAILLRRQLPFALISDWPEDIVKRAYFSGIRYSDVDLSKVQILPRDNRILLRAKKYLSKNVLVSSTIDFRNGFDSYRWLSDAMLRLAHATKARTVFALNDVNDRGEVRLACKDINTNGDLEDSKAAIIKFIAERKPHSRFEFYKFSLKETNERLRRGSNRGL